MIKKVLLDTNIFISVINRELNYSECENILISIEKGKINGLISTIIISELMIGYNLNDDSIHAQKLLKNLKANYIIQDMNVDIALQAANLHAKNKIKLPDALILATSIFTKCDYLITQDMDFIKNSQGKAITPQDFINCFHS